MLRTMRNIVGQVFHARITSFPETWVGCNHSSRFGTQVRHACIRVRGKGEETELFHWSLCRRRKGRVHLSILSINAFFAESTWAGWGAMVIVDSRGDVRVAVMAYWCSRRDQPWFTTTVTAGSSSRGFHLHVLFGVDGVLPRSWTVREGVVCGSMMMMNSSTFFFLRNLGQNHNVPRMQKFWSQFVSASFQREGKTEIEGINARWHCSRSKLILRTPWYKTDGW
jgi:hypothetical protein